MRGIAAGPLWAGFLYFLPARDVVE